jgi:hypothetical protein
LFLPPWEDGQAGRNFNRSLTGANENHSITSRGSRKTTLKTIFSARPRCVIPAKENHNEAHGSDSPTQEERRVFKTRYTILNDLSA